jgi:hypothetical protein
VNRPPPGWGRRAPATGAPAGEDGSQGNVSSVQDDLQVNLGVDSYGPLVCVTDGID